MITMPVMQDKKSHMQRDDPTGQIESECLGNLKGLLLSPFSEKLVKQSPSLVQLDDNIYLQIGWVMVTAL